MRRRTPIAIAVLAVAAAAALGWSGCGDPDRADTPTPHPDLVERARGSPSGPIPPRRRDVSPDDATPARVAISASPATVTSRTVELRVLHADGTPAGGAAIRVVELQDWFGPLRDVANAVAAADGCARIAVTPSDGDPNSETELRLHVLRGDEAAYEHIGDAKAGWRGDVKLEPGRSLSGRVIDEDGRPIVGAAVTLRVTHMLMSFVEDTRGAEVDATTDARGEFALAALPRSELRESISVRATASGHASRSVHGFGDGLSSPLELRLPAGVAVRARCVDGAGRPVANTRIGFVDDYAGGVETGADGRAEIAGLIPAGRTFFAFASGRAPVVRADLSAQGGDVDLGDVTLGVGGRIHGVVVGGDGRPMADVHVTVGQHGFCVHVCDTRADGRFVFDHVGDGDYDVAAAATPQDGAYEADGVCYGGVRAGAAEQRIVLTGARMIEVRVVDDVKREPVRVCPIRVGWRALPPGDAASGVWQSEILASGVRFRVPHGGPYALEVEAPGFQTRTMERVDADESRPTVVEVALHRP